MPYLLFLKKQQNVQLLSAAKIGGALRNKSGLSIMWTCIVGSQCIIFKQNVFHSLNNDLF